MTHDVCGPGTIGIFKQHFGKDAKVWDRDKVVIIPDHYIFTADAMANRNVDVLRQFVGRAGAAVLLRRRHATATRASATSPCPRKATPGPARCCFGTDSHTCTAGAFGEFATGIGNTDAGFVMGTGKLWLKVPPTMRFVFHGKLPPYLMAKDLILAVIGDIGCDGATYQAMEFDGDGVYALNIEERMTLCNMVIEAGGKNGVIAPDQVTLDYVNARNAGKKPYTVVKTDAGAKFMLREGLRRDASWSRSSPSRTARTTGRTSREVKGTKLDRAYIGSCTGGKMTDFRAAAGDPQGQDGARSTRSSCRRPARSPRGLKTEKLNGQTLEEVFLAAGAKIGEPSCAACLGGPSDTFGRLNDADELHQHDQPQLPRPHGPQGGAGVPGQPADRGGQRRDRHDHRPARLLAVKKWNAETSFPCPLGERHDVRRLFILTCCFASGCSEGVLFKEDSRGA